MKKIAVISGARRGLGLATGQALAAKGYEVVLGVRTFDPTAKFGAGLLQMPLDVTDQGSVKAFNDAVLNRFGKVDVLINNAAIFVDSKAVADVAASFLSNTLGALAMCNAWLPDMIKNNFGRIVNISSGMGQLSEMQAGYMAYRISKTAMNAMTRVLAAEVNGKNILINSVCPGWVRTEMGGAQAPRSIDEGIAGIVWAATLPDGGPSGGFFRDGKALAW